MMKNLFFAQEILLITFVTGFFITCNSSSGKKTSAFNQGISQICDSIGKSQNLEKASQYLDSIYYGLSSPTLAEKVLYYTEKLRLFTSDPPYRSDSPVPLALPYLDTITILMQERHDNDVNKIYAEALLNAGNFLFRKADYEKAKSLVAEARIYGMALNDTCYLLNVSQLLANIVFRQWDFKRAIAHTKEGLQLMDGCKADFFYRKQRMLDDLGFFYLQEKKIDSAIYYHIQAERFVEVNKEMHSDTLFPYRALQNIYANLAFDYRSAGNTSLATQYYTKAANTALMLKDSVGMAEVISDLAVTYLRVGRVDSGNKLVKKINPYVERMSPAHRNSYYRFRVELADSLRNMNDLVSYLKKCVTLQDTALRDANLARSNDPELAYERLDKKYQIKILQRDNRIQRNKVTAAIITGLTLLAGIVVSLILLGRLRKLVKKKDELNQALKESLKERDRIGSELRQKEFLAQEMEFLAAILEQRRQISDDMHDELSSSLAALKFLVTDLKKRSGGGEPEKILGEIEAEVSSVYTSARGYMHSLKTNDWTTRFSLTGLLKDVQQKFRQKNLMDVVLKIDEEGIKHRLSTSQHDQLYHITKECVSNVIKHANATRLQIRVLFGHGTCHFEIQDNGRGFDAEKVMWGIGLESITKRVTGMGGTVDIQSSDTGTTISGNFPVD